ncbi:fungal pheromone STE3G-protein-coupled receptor [Cylindrobasidium torrendii FP15055 ss-10]|uniref:Fungal pheromone STE3G-protein-coupled receptor n=1 Tax=Cylindrobasidium torrendii FP15055 ss-10 TaxID=1314674 RepID=A0A0D7AVW5_9AGAR|nr:fungal pheromone STE3G-protein-coupled receptor [Cylindrobasidium torrendii FP15055 ss-10]
MSAETLLYAVFSLIGFVLSFIPLPWHMQAGNIGTCALMFWVGIGCLQFGINAIVWNDNSIVSGVGWCDISVRFITGLVVSLPLCSLCINRRLYFIASKAQTGRLVGNPRRDAAVDLFICFVVPAVFSLLTVVFSGARYGINEDYGCVAVLHSSWPLYALYLAPPIIIGLISSSYCVLSICHFKRQRKSFNDVLRKSSGMSSNHYFRLMAIASIDIFITVPIACFSLMLNAEGQHFPWRGWAWLHEGYWTPSITPKALWTASPAVHILFELSRWTPVFAAFLFFALFGLTEQARNNYSTVLGQVLGSRVWQKVSTKCTFNTSSNTIKCVVCCWRE